MNTLQIAKTACMVLLLLSVACSEYANAEFYLQGEYGRAQVDDVLRFDFPGTRIDTNVSALRVAAGYRFSPRFSVETGHVEFGRYTGILATDKWYASADGQDLVLTARFAASERFAVEVFGGAFWWDGDLRLGTAGDNVSGNDITYGIGAHFRIGERVDIGLRIAKYRLDDLDIAYGSGMLRFYF